MPEGFNFDNALPSCILIIRNRDMGRVRLTSLNALLLTKKHNKFIDVNSTP